MSNVETVVPATILNEIKTGLIAVGYAHESTPLSFVQDAYFKYVMINQTGFNPSIPYAIALLPQSIQAQLAPEVPNVPIIGMWAYTQGMDDQNRIVGDFTIQISVDPYNATIDTSQFYFTIRDVASLSLIDPVIEFAHDEWGGLYASINIDTELFVDGNTYEFVMNYGDTVLLDFEPHTFKLVAPPSPLDQVERFTGNLQSIDSDAYYSQVGGANSAGYTYAQLARNEFADLYTQNIRFEPRMITGNFKTSVALHSYNKVNEYFALAVTQLDKNAGILNVTDSLAITGENQDSNGGLVLVFVGAEGHATYNAGDLILLEGGVELANVNINTLNADNPNRSLNLTVEGVYQDDGATNVTVKVIDSQGSGEVYLEVTRPVDLTDADGNASCVLSMSSKLVDDVASKGVDSMMSYSIDVREDYQWFNAHI